MPRVQLSLNVSDLAAAVYFCRRLFGVELAKLKPGYANFAIDSPPSSWSSTPPATGQGRRSTTSASRSNPPSRLTRQGSGWKAQVSTRCQRTRPAAATPGRPKSGPTTPTGRRGSTTRSWPTLTLPTASPQPPARAATPPACGEWRSTTGELRPGGAVAAAKGLLLHRFPGGGRDPAGCGKPASVTGQARQTAHQPGAGQRG